MQRGEKEERGKAERRKRQKGKKKSRGKGERRELEWTQRGPKKDKVSNYTITTLPSLNYQSSSCSCPH